MSAESLVLSHPPFATQSVSQQISDYLRAAIVQGSIKPSQRLIEETLAQQLGVSRTPVREALRRLEAEGLVEFQAQKGARVRSVSLDELNALYELRILLEGYAARLAAKKITPETLDVLKKNSEAFLAVLNQSEGRGQQIEKLIALNNAFHIEIVQVSGNRHLIRVAKSLLESNALFGVYYYYDPRKSRMSYREHVAIVEALAKRQSARAARLMQAHLQHAQALIRRAMQQIGDADHKDKGRG